MVAIWEVNTDGTHDTNCRFRWMVCFEQVDIAKVRGIYVTVPELFPRRGS